MNNKIEKLSYKELIKALNCCANTIETNMCGECPAAKYKAGTCDDLVKLQAAEMLKDFKVKNEKLKERVTPKKVQITDDTYPLEICPGCNIKYHPHGFKYCSECGQALDWSDDK